MASVNYGHFDSILLVFARFCGFVGYVHKVMSASHCYGGARFVFRTRLNGVSAGPDAGGAPVPQRRCACHSGVSVSPPSSSLIVSQAVLRLASTSCRWLRIGSSTGSRAPTPTTASGALPTQRLRSARGCAAWSSAPTQRNKASSVCRASGAERRATGADRACVDSRLTDCLTDCLDATRFRRPPL